VIATPILQKIQAISVRQSAPFNENELQIVEGRVRRYEVPLLLSPDLIEGLAERGCHIDGAPPIKSGGQET